MYAIALKIFFASAHSKEAGVVETSFFLRLMARGRPFTLSVWGPLASTVSLRASLFGFSANPVARISVKFESTAGIIAIQPFFSSRAVLSDATR